MLDTLFILVPGPQSLLSLGGNDSYIGIVNARPDRFSRHGE